METTITTKEVHAMYRCKNCKPNHVWRMTWDLTIKGNTKWKEYSWQRSGEISWQRKEYPPYQKCPECGFNTAGKRISGRYSEVTECNIRCTSAIGHDCDCSCAGKNHGMDHELAR